MARKTQIVKAERNSPKYATQYVNRCALCGRGRGYLRKFKLCRHCFRKLASEGKIPGVKKASW